MKWLESTPTTAGTENGTTSYYSLQMCTVFHRPLCFSPVFVLIHFWLLCSIFFHTFIFWSFVPGKWQNKDVLFKFLNIIMPPLLLFLLLHLFSFIFLLYSTYCNLCHISIPCIYPKPLPRTSLHLPPITPFASYSLRQPLSAWLKSSGPTGRAKPWVCFPSERLLFAHSGN